jgi:threonyl-tRNA synthetase
VDTSTADEQLGKRIRSAKLERIPFVLVVGDDDVANQTVGVNPRGGEVIRDVKFATFVDQLRAETKSAANISGLQG